MAMNKPKYIIVHHTSGTAANPLADTSHHTFDTIKHWHVQGRGWKDIGYHWVIEKDGSVRKGRDESSSGAHAVGYNKKSIGVCLSGNFDLTFPTKEQTDALRTLLKEIVDRWNINTEDIIPHRDVANKTCYGMNLPEDWARHLVESDQEHVCNLHQFTTSELLSELVNRLVKK